MIQLSGRTVAKYMDGVTYFPHPNHLGSTTSVTNHLGATIQKTIYYPFGQVWASTATVKDSRFAWTDPRDSETGNDLKPELASKSVIKAMRPKSRCDSLPQ